MKNRLWISFIAMVAAIVLLVPAIAQESAPPHGAAGASAPATAGIRRDRFLSGKAVELSDDFAEALGVIANQYATSNGLDYNAVTKSAIIGMLRSLDPHSNYFDPKEFEEFLTEQRSEYFGIGTSIGDHQVGDVTSTYIMETFNNSPAARAGLRYGDRIVAVNGESMSGKSYHDVRERIRGPQGTKVSITIEHAATRQQETVEITRDAVPQPSIPDAYMLRPGVGYIAMTGGFNMTTADEFQAKLDELHAKGLNSLVLDLRNNPGGLVSQAVRIADIFLQRGQVIVSQKGRVRGSSHTYLATNTAPDPTALVILVSRGTASASEILVGAMQDHDRALVVGETTFGKGLVQAPFPLPYNAGLLLTFAKYYTPSGRLIQRDYSNGGFYDYLVQGLTRADDADKRPMVAPPVPVGAVSRTDTGRPVYGGGGIAPDDSVKPRIITAAQRRLNDPIFAFTRELVNGRIAGFDAYHVKGPIEYNHNLKPSDFPITEPLYNAFKAFVAAHPAMKLSAAQIERNRAFVQDQLRFEICTAAYGTISALEVFNASDPQVAKATELLPRARDLAALAAARSRAQ